jgi:hypothetical protein
VGDGILVRVAVGSGVLVGRGGVAVGGRTVAVGVEGGLVEISGVGTAAGEAQPLMRTRHINTNNAKRRLFIRGCMTKSPFIVSGR